MRVPSSFPWIPVFVTLVAIIFAASPQLAHGQTADSATLNQISSQRYIVIDDQTGEIFAEKDADVRGGMASLTKVFTAIVALERAPLDMQIETSDSDTFDSTSTTMTGFAPGRTYTVRDLVYGMLLESGNDAAHALARGIGAQPGDDEEQSVARFVGWMNDKVAQLGLTNTHFVNPHGLSDPDHYSTPRDLATFLMYASLNPDFMQIISARDYTTSTGDVLRSVNRGPEFIPDYVGGKTGFDEQTGYCLIEIGKRGDVQLVSVTIDGVAPEVWYQDHAILENYGFAALADRLASGQPLGDNVLAFTQESPLVQAQPDESQTQQQAAQPGDNAFTGEVAGPRPVQVTEPVAAPPQSSRNPNSVFDNWPVGLAVLLLVVVAIAVKSGLPIPGPKPTPPTPHEIDTPA